MVELLVGLAVLVAVMLFVGLIGAVVAMFLGLVLLPFKLLAFVFRGLGALLVLPLLLVAGLVAFAVFGAGMLVLAIPALPLILLIAAVVWLVRRSSRGAPRAV